MKIVLIALIAILAVALAAPNARQLKFRNLYKEPIIYITPSNSGRIINGEIAEPHSIPYQAFLEVYSDNGGWYCGATLIAEDVLLTAGHCSYKAITGTVILGAQKPMAQEATQIMVQVTNFVIHPDFDMDRILYDISLIRLDEPIKLTDAVQLATLPTNNSDNFVGKTGRVSGWGLTDGHGYVISDTLRYTENPVLSNEECGQFFGSIPDYQLCTSGEGGNVACGGDSGGPLTVDGLQVGIVSYTVLYCLEGYPTYYTRVSSFLDWISENSSA